MKLLQRIAYPSPRWLLLSAVFCLFAYLVTIPMPHEDGHLTGSDGLYYFSILRSAVLDGDLDFSNDYQLLGIDAPTTPNGHKSNPYAVGAAIFWLPFFLLAHALASVVHAAGGSVNTNGVGYLYEGAICVATVMYSLLGIWLSYAVIRRAQIGDESSAVASLLTLWWASNAVYYAIIEPSMTHGLTIFSIALFLFCWYPATQERSFLHWMVLGLAASLVTLTRWQDGVILLLPLSEFVWRVWRREEPLTRLLTKGLCFLILFTVGFSPQMVMWKIVYGHYLTIPQGSGFMQWLNPHPLQMLFASRHGLFSWHPVYVLPLLGLRPLFMQDKSLAAAVLAMLLCAIYINSATFDWAAGHAFGARRFISLIPLLAIPLSAFVATLKPDGWLTRERLAGLVLALIAWNSLCVLQYRFGGIDRGRDLTLRQMTLDRTLLPFNLIGKHLRFPGGR